MRIPLNRLTLRLLYWALFPIVLALRLTGWVLGGRERQAPLVYHDTLEGDPLAYRGPRPVVVSIWADWAPVWKAAAAEIVAQMREEFAGRCEFVYVQATQAAGEKFKVDVVPTVLVYCDGAETGRFTNLLQDDALRACIRAAVAKSPDSL
jgi:Thioredoxin